MTRPILHTTHLTIGYQPRRQPATVIAADLNLALQPGELVCLLGANGTGKSTLMRTLAGMQPPLAGQVWLDELDLFTLPAQRLAQKLSVVLTERVDVGLLSAYDLVALGRYPYTDWWGSLTADDEAIVQQALQDVGALSLAGRPVAELSDGERQKVMIARALAQTPQVMILDEPTAFLDLPRRVEIIKILRRLAHERDRAVLLSTHDLDLALSSADVMWLLTNGRLHVGAPEDLVLRGIFAHAFASEGITFDALRGTFQMQQGYKGKIDVVGEGIPAVWTRRALERVGYQTHAGRNGSPLQVVCHETEWHLVGQNSRSQHHSLADLTAALRHKEAPDE